MPPFRSTGYALSNVLGGIIGAQSPQGQLARARVATEEDELQQTKRTREFLKDFKWDQPNAAENALRGLATIDPAFSSPLINLTYEKGLRAIREDRQRKFAEEYRSFAPGGISDEELARSQATRVEYGLDDVRERDPLRFEPYRIRAEASKTGSDYDQMLEFAKGWLPYYKFLVEQGATPEEQEEAWKQYITSGGFFNPKAIRRTPQRSDAEVKRLEKRLVASDDVKQAVLAKYGEVKKRGPLGAIANALPYVDVPEESVTDVPMYDEEGFLTPEWENVLTDIASGKVTVSPETKKLVDEYVTALGLSPGAGEKKGIPGFND